MPKKLSLTIGLFALCVLHAPAQAPKTILDIWEAAYLQGGKAGSVHTTTVEIDKDGQKLYRTTMELNLTVKRFQDTIQLRMDVGNTETAEGKVVGVFKRHYLGKAKSLDLQGVVVGKELKLTLDGAKQLEPAPWNDAVVGLYRQQSLLKEKKVKPGDTFSYLSFEPSINLVVNTTVHVKDYEIVELFGNKTKKRLLRVETQPDKIENVQLPAFITWVNEDYIPERSQSEIPGLGSLVLYRTTKQLAMAPGSPATLTDIGIGQYIKLKQKITSPYATRSATYRITVKGDEDPASTFVRDGRQTVTKADNGAFELRIQAGGIEAKDKVTKEFLESSYFINSADSKVRELARIAVGPAKDAWTKAVRIEKWVNANMRVTSHEALATADHVAKTLEGDCTECAMLTAAMCRAMGIPSKTAIGLIYADVPGSGPVFAFHMWTEVFVDGKWMPLDATLGRGYVGATHLKICDHHWHDVRTMTPLFPVLRVIGRVSIDVISAN